MFVNKKQQIKKKTPSLWSMSNWIERIIIFGNPFFIIYIIWKILGG
jgi:hypothetical protein